MSLQNIFDRYDSSVLMSLRVSWILSKWFK